MIDRLLIWILRKRDYAVFKREDVSKMNANMWANKMCAYVAMSSPEELQDITLEVLKENLLEAYRDLEAFSHKEL